MGWHSRAVGPLVLVDVDDLLALLSFGHNFVTPPLVPNRSLGKYSGKVMTMTPFGPSVQEVPLTRAPLVNVIAQVRFPAVMKIEADSGFVATFQELIRKATGRRDGLALRDQGPGCLAGNTGSNLRVPLGQAVHTAQ